MIKYLGSKRVLLPRIVEIVRLLGDVRTVLDPFSGTARVGHALKGAGFRVIANDHNAYAATLARGYVATDREDVEEDARTLLADLNRLPGRPGWFTRTYAEEARFLHPRNAARVEAVRERIAELALAPALEAVLLVSLLEAADRVDSTTGVQMAYLKEWAPRALREFELRLPELQPRPAHGRCEAHALDALECAARCDADLAYLDPPYNQHSYLGNYHVWETLVRWDEPATYGVARKRVDVRARTSPFNSRRRIADAFTQLVERLRARTLIVSFNDEGFLTRAQIEAILSTRGEVRVLEHDYPRYVGARIGIHNPRGERVGRISHLRNKELLFVAGAGVERLAPLLGGRAHGTLSAAPSRPRNGASAPTPSP